MHRPAPNDHDAQAHPIIEGNAARGVGAVWLGSKDAAKSDEFIRDAKIGFIINATPSLKNKHIRKGVRYIRVPVDDSLQVTDIKNMTRWLPYVVLKMRRELRDGHNVLVHCHAGMQRSAIIVAAYLVQYHHLTPTEAVNYIIARRNIAFLQGESVNFIASLTEYYRTLKMFQLI